MRNQFFGRGGQFIGSRASGPALALTTAPTQSRSAGTVTVTLGATTPAATTVVNTVILDGVRSPLVGLTFAITAGQTGILEQVFSRAGYADLTVTAPPLFYPLATDMVTGDWATNEAVADTDSRKTVATATKDPRSAGYVWHVVRGSLATVSAATPPTAFIGTGSLMGGSAGAWSWQSAGLTAVGTDSYVRIVEVETAVGVSSARWASGIKSFKASNLPAAPSFAVAAGAGAGELTVNIFAIPAMLAPGDLVRVTTGYEWRANGMAAYLPLSGGAATGIRTLTGMGAAARMIEVRAINANAAGASVVSPAVNPGAGAVDPTISASAARLGQTLTIIKPGAFAAQPHYLVGRLPGRTVWEVLDLADVGLSPPIPSNALGLQLAVAVANLDAGGVYVGTTYTNLIGPIRQAVDPVGTVVSTPAQLQAALATSATTIILSGGDWNFSAVDFTGVDKTAAPLTITTLQSDPARAYNTAIDLKNAKYVTFLGVQCYQAAAYAATAGYMFNFATSDNCQAIACHQYGDYVPPAIYNDVSQVDIGTGRPIVGATYWGRGMDFMPETFDGGTATNLTIRDTLMCDVWRAATLPGHSNFVFENNTIHGVYYDGVGVAKRGSVTGIGGIIRNNRGYGVYCVYEEMDWNGSVGDAPHFDWAQFFYVGGANAGSGGMWNHILEGNAFFVGNTRNLAVGGGTDWLLNNASIYDSEFRANIGTMYGSHALTVSSGADTSFFRNSMLTQRMNGISGGISLANVIGTTPYPYEGEATVDSNMMGGVVSFKTSSPNARMNKINTQESIGGTATTYIRGPANPGSLIEGVLALRPQAGYETRTAVTTAGYLSIPPRAPLVSSISLTPTAGGFTGTVTPGASVPAVDMCGLRYRKTTDLGWTYVEQSGAAFAVSALDGLTGYHVSVRARSATGGWGRWRQAYYTVTTLAIAPVTAPTLTFIGAGGFSPATSAAANRAQYDTVFAAAPAAVEHVVLTAMIQKASGGGSSIISFDATTPNTWRDASNVTVAPTPTIELDAITTSGAAKSIAITRGTPASTVRKAGTWWTASGGVLLSTAAFAYRIDTAVNFAAAVKGWSASDTITLTGVQPGSRVLVVAGSEVLSAFTWAGATADQVVTNAGGTPTRMESAVISMPTGGSITITAAGATVIGAIAIPPA